MSLDLCPNRDPRIRSQIRKYCSENGMSLNQLRQKLGCNGNSWSKFMRGAYKNMWSACQSSCYWSAGLYLAKEDLRKKIRVKEAAAAAKLNKKQSKKRSTTAITSAAASTTPLTLAKRSRLDKTPAAVTTPFTLAKRSRLDRTPASAKSSPACVSGAPIKETAKVR